jgi:hypothetical protein
VKRKFKSQPKIKGIKRIPTSASMHPEMQEKIADIARRYGVSKSWVANTFTAAGMRFSKQEPFYNVSKLRRVK